MLGPMAIKIVEIHPAESPDALNTEWFVVENDGQRPFSTRNCALVRGRKGTKKKRELGIMDPGFIVAPGERVRVHTGHPGRKSHGAKPDDGAKDYNLFLNESILQGAGTTLTITLRSAKVARATYDPEGDSGVAVKKPK
jgi:hypothetical protein